MEYLEETKLVDNAFCVISRGLAENREGVLEEALTNYQPELQNLLLVHLTTLNFEIFWKFSEIWDSKSEKHLKRLLEEVILDREKVLEFGSKITSLGEKIGVEDELFAIFSLSCQLEGLIGKSKVFTKLTNFDKVFLPSFDEKIGLSLLHLCLDKDIIVNLIISRNLKKSNESIRLVKKLLQFGKNEKILDLAFEFDIEIDYFGSSRLIEELKGNYLNPRFLENAKFEKNTLPLACLGILFIESKI